VCKRSLRTPFRSGRIRSPRHAEKVWQALATGPGISPGFVPTEIEERDGKPVAVKYNFGPGVEIRSVVTACRCVHGHSPRRRAGWSPDSPPMATEWRIEARGGGSCTVRVVH